MDFLTPKVSFHKLPKEMEKREAWLNILGINQSIPKLSDVCSEHFEEKDFTLKKSLKSDALPKEEVIKDPCIEDNSLQTELHEPQAKSEVTETVSDTQHAQDFEEYVTIKSEMKEEEVIGEKEYMERIQDNRLEPATFVDQDNTRVKTEPVDRDINLDVNKFMDYSIKNEEVLFKEEPGEAGTNDNSETRVTTYGGENIDRLLNSPTFIKTEDENEDQICETTQHEAIDGEDDLGYTTYLIYNGINIRIENDIGNRTKPLNPSELSKRYREKIKQDPERWAEYLRKATERHYKNKLSKSLSSSGEVKVTIKEDPPIKKEPPIKIPKNRPKQTRKPHLYKCNRCGFETKYKHYIKVHVLKHKTPEDNQIVKCDHCDYQTIHKTGLKQHILRHRDPKEVKKYHCENCSYQTLSKANFNRHSLVHKDKTEVVFHKCLKCDFQTVYKDSLKKHSSTQHNNLDEVGCSNA